MSNVSNTKTATIAQGQTLSGIATANNTSVNALMAANPNIKDANKITAGASINIPTASSQSVVSKTPVAQTPTTMAAAARTANPSLPASNPKAIGGSGSAAMATGINKATTSASKSLAPATTPTPTATAAKTQDPTSTNPATMVVTPTTKVTDPNLAAYQNEYNTGVSQIEGDFNVQTAPLTNSYNQAYSMLQTDKASAIQSATKSYDIANPYSSGSDKEQFINSISQGYDKQMSDLSTNYNTQMAIANQNKNDAKQNLRTQFDSNVLNFQNNLKASGQTGFKDYISGLKSGDGTMTADDVINMNNEIEKARASGLSDAEIKSEINGALEYAKRTTHKQDIADTKLDLQIAASNRAAAASERAAKSADKQGYDKASVLEQVGVEKFIASSPTININGKDVTLTSADWAAAKNDPDMFNLLVGYAIDAKFISETSVPANP